MARVLMVILAASAALPQPAGAERRALFLVEADEAIGEREARAARARLESAGIELDEPTASEGEARPDPDLDRARALAREGMVLLARGELESADAALAAALDALPVPAPASIREEAFGACLDRARVARRAGDEAGAEARVAECRRSFPLEEVDPRRTPPEIGALVARVDAGRARVALEPGAEGCRASATERGAPLTELVALPGAVVVLSVACRSGLAFERRVRVDGGAQAIDLSPRPGERIVAGRPPRLHSADPAADAAALSAARGAAVFVLCREGSARALLRADGDGVVRARGADAAEAAERLVSAPRRAKRARRLRAAAWGTGAAGLAFYGLSLASTARRAASANRLGGLAPHDPAFLEERDRFDGRRSRARLGAALGALGLGAAASLGRPVSRRASLVSAGAGVALVVAGAALFASAPACDAGQARFSTCLAREVRRDAALLVGSAATPFFALASRAWFARRRPGLTLGVGPGSVSIAFRAPGPRARDDVSSRRKE